MKGTDEIINKIKFGVDYYPEHWPRERWETDARLMQQLGIQIVRMAEFAWQKLEPKEGEFCFDWLDDAISLLGRYGIYTMLGTPSAAPPAWIIEEDPEILPMDSQGQRKGFGGRHHDCMSNAHYREHITRLVTAMAEHYKDNPYVAAWQIDNELGNSHADMCMCDSCRNSFQKWLKKKYEKIDNLNEKWGTVFWSQTYDKFEQIPAPRQTPTVHNPSLLLDWKRFCSDLVTEFQRMQVQIIRKVAPHQKITHNLMGFYDKTDYFKMSKDLDFASNDQYPTGYYFDPPGQPPYEVSACMDLIRSVKKQNFWMLEMQSGPTGGNVIGASPRPGQNRVWTTQSVAHGADAIVYFRWRTCLFGTEQFWHGILPHHGNPDRRYYEIRDTIRMLTPVMEDTQGIVPVSNVGILYSYDEVWAVSLQPQHPDLDYTGLVQKYYSLLHGENIPVDFLSFEDPLEQYKIVIAPLLYLMRSDLEEKLSAYVKAGGTLILTMRTGVMDFYNVCMGDQYLPGNLSEAAGIEVEEYDSLWGKQVLLEYDGRQGTADKWCDIIRPTTAKTLVSYASEYYSGKPAVTLNQYGKGSVYYIGTDPDNTTLNWLFDKIFEGYAELTSDNPNVELVVRKGKKKDYLFVINHTEQFQNTTVPKVWEKEGKVSLKPYDVLILEKEHK